MRQRLYRASPIILLFAVFCGCADVGVGHKDESGKNGSARGSSPTSAVDLPQLCVIDLVDDMECWFSVSEGRFNAGAYTPDNWVFVCTNLATVVSATPRLLSERVGQKPDVVVCYQGTAPEIAASHFKRETFDLCFEQLKTGLQAEGVTVKRAQGSFHFTRYPVIRPPKNR